MEPDTKAATTPERRRRRLVFVLAALLILLLVTLLDREEKPRSVPTAPDTPTVEPIPPPTRTVEAPAAAPDPGERPVTPEPDEPVAPEPPPDKDVVPVDEPPTPGLISGIVRTEAGGAEGARVEAHDAGGRCFTGPWGLKTDAAGRFAIDVGEAEWPVRLRFGHQGYLVVHREVPEATNGLVIALDPGLSIEGRLLDENGKGVESAVSALRLDAHGKVIARHGLGPALWSRCDGNGRFVIRGVAPGRYEVGYVGANFARVAGSKTRCDAGDRGVEIFVRRAVVLLLRITDATTGGDPKRQLTIHLTDREANVRHITAGVGKVRSPGLAPGDYSLRISAPGYRTVDRPRLTLDRLGGVHELDIALERKGDWGDGTIDVRVPCPEDPDVSHPLLWVMIRDAHGQPIEGDPGPHRRSGTEFRVTRKVAAGRYRVHAWTKDGRWATRTVEVKTAWDRTESVELTLHRSGWLRLTVKQAEHPRRAIILESPERVRQGVSLWDALPARSGKFGPLAPGTVIVRLLDGGVEVESKTVEVVAGKEVPVSLR